MAFNAEDHGKLFANTCPAMLRQSRKPRGTFQKGFTMKIAMFGRTGLGLIAAAGLCLSAPALAAEKAGADVKAGVDAWGHGDFAKALHIWQPLAAKGDPDALFNLGQAYMLGRGVPQDLARAEMLYAKAAQQGHMEAGDNYGILLYQRGQHAAAMPYIRASADHGEPRALYLLGLAYFNAEEMTKDWVRAYALESLAAQPTPRGPGLAQAKQALAQMDQYIPMEERQKGISLASELATQIEGNRQRLTTAADLGTHTPPVAEARIPAPAPPPAPAKPAPRPAPSPSPSPAPAPASGPWKLQLGAFGVAANGDALWAKLKNRPEIAGHPRQNVVAGKVTRLLATGYGEDAAHAACHRLTGAGLSCIAIHD